MTQPPVRPCERCGQYACTCTAGPSFFSQLVAEANIDPMVPPGCIEIHDAGGKLLSRRFIGDKS